MDNKNKSKVNMHSFDINDAIEYSVYEAIILSNLRFWLEKNLANGTHIYDGRVWTFNSVSAYSKLFPYLTPSQIRYALDKLIERGVLITGNYNKIAYDRTKWYTVNENRYIVDREKAGVFHNIDEDPLLPVTNGVVNGSKDPLLPVTNGVVNGSKPIPDINTDRKQDIKDQIENKIPETWKEAEKLGWSIQDYLNAYDLE